LEEEVNSLGNNFKILNLHITSFDRNHIREDLEAEGIERDPLLIIGGDLDTTISFREV